MTAPYTPGGSRRRRDTLEVRPGRPLDLDHLVELWTEYVSFHERVGRERLAPQGAELRVRDALLEDLQSRSARLLVAEDRGELHGYILGRLLPIPAMYEGSRLGVVEEFIVTASSRRLGIGSRLLRSLTDWFRTRKASRIELTVHPDNEEARGFWEAAGFDITGLRFSRRP